MSPEDRNIKGTVVSPPRAKLKHRPLAFENQLQRINQHGSESRRKSVEQSLNITVFSST